MSARASGADPTPNGKAGDAKHRAHNDGSAGRAYTVEQKTAVIRVRRCQATAFYDILGLESQRTTATDGEIKKAYRKLSLLTHPDKNGYDGADEAFKMVSRAFQILSDPEKKGKYDRFGGDPDNRFSGASASASSPFSGFARSPGAGRAGPMFEEDLTPEEMFRRFFGGGGFGGGPFGGGMFDTGPGFVFNLGGGPGVRVHQFGGARPRRRPPGTGHQGDEYPSTSTALWSLLPLLAFFLIPLLMSLLNPSSDPTTSFRFDTPTPPYTQSHTSSRFGVTYFVQPNAVVDFSSRAWQDLDRVVENRYATRLSTQCELEDRRQRRMMEDAQGWFSVDEDMWRAAKHMSKPNCERLNQMRYAR